MKTVTKNEKARMNRSGMNMVARTTLLIGSAVIVAVSLSGCMSAEEQRRANLHEDGGTCSDFGADYGSRSYTQCMLQQQQRRDQEQLLNLERARISSETARNNLEMMETLRKRRQ